MSLDNNQKSKIEKIISDALRKKLVGYKPETNHKPFHTRLLSKDWMAKYSFVQSLNTTLGVSIYEQVGEIIASKEFVYVEKQYKVGGIMYSKAQETINDIMNELSKNEDTGSDKLSETSRINKVCQTGAEVSLKPVKADLYLKDKHDRIFLIDIKTVKPNKGDFQKMKRTLLDWLAIELAKSPNSDIHTMIAIPYNPYFPKDYKRWTVENMFDYEHELKVGEDFWNFLGGPDTYYQLLKCFEDIGLEFRERLEEHIEMLGGDYQYWTNS
ncbi:MAG: TdeIII family type II restriction endonuclease [Rhodobacteraceae bacterium]|nr:TdeIII family type II restriction endonuclease [Paracoccaceae bacterium]